MKGQALLWALGNYSKHQVSQLQAVEGDKNVSGEQVSPGESRGPTSLEGDLGARTWRKGVKELGAWERAQTRNARAGVRLIRSRASERPVWLSGVNRGGRCRVGG